MRKKVLFVLQSIGYGGSMTSLINLLYFLGKETHQKYDVLFMNPYGELLDDAKTVANVLATPAILKSVFVRRSVLKKKHRYDLLILRFILAFIARLFCTSTLALVSNTISLRYKKYETVIAYQESIATDFVSHFKNSKKIAWVHNDYSNVIKLYPSKNVFFSVYNSFNKIICVSSAGVKSFRQRSGLTGKQILYIYNTLDIDKITKLSEENISKFFLQDCDQKALIDFINFSGLKLISSGRFTSQKRFDRVIEVSRRLLDEDVRFKWIILGDGEQKSQITQDIKNKKLDENVFTLGAVKNPFAIVSHADFFVLTSDFEAHPMVANESLILNVPVISTNFESAAEVVTHGVNGLICDMSSDGIYMAIRSIYNDRTLKKLLKDGAKAFEYSNKEIIDAVLNEM